MWNICLSAFSRVLVPHLAPFRGETGTVSCFWQVPFPTSRRQGCPSKFGLLPPPSGHLESASRMRSRELAVKASLPGSLTVNGGGSTRQPIQKPAGVPTSQAPWTGNRCPYIKGQQLQYLSLLTFNYFFFPQTEHCFKAFCSPVR